MQIDQKVINRLQELIEIGSDITIQASAGADGIARSTSGRGGVGGAAIAGSPGYVRPTFRGSTTDLNAWAMSCLNILKTAFGEESEHYKVFKEYHEQFFSRPSAYRFQAGIGILVAAKQDYEGGFIFKLREVIQAEVFADFLEEAEYLLGVGYHEPAAVITGSVLEDGLRKLAAKHGVALAAKATMGTVNMELYKADVYSKLVMQQINALATLRNHAAHGQWDQFTEQDVKNMIPQVRTFMQQHF